MTVIDKKAILADLKELETAELFVTDKTDIIDTEIYNNAIAISFTEETAKQLAVSDITAFLAKLKSNRQGQLAQTNIQVDLIYYLWFDEMAGQLRLNFINSNHIRLPFSCNLINVNTEEEIVETFLKSDYHTGISFDELTDVENDENENDPASYHLKVYQQTITRDLHQSEKKH